MRITPIINQTVPYTYDQGRDFLKAEEIVRDKNIPFIGPTTGIQGVYHGAWWYYFLLVPYLLTSGWPKGFYYALFFLNTTANILFFIFLYRVFGYLPSLIFFMIVSISPYFIRNAFFVSNDMMAPIFVMLLMFSIYKIFESKEKKYLILTGLSLGFIFESEVAFGIFLIPVSILTLLIYKRDIVSKKILFFITGLILPMVPRLLFELKNGFMQSKALVLTFFQKKEAHPLLFGAVAEERFRTFVEYWNDLFFERNKTLSFTILAFVIIALFVLKKLKVEPVKRKFAYFFLTIIGILFIVSLFYRGNFFWGYYFQGAQYFYLILLIISVYGAVKLKKTLFLAYFLGFILFALNLVTVYRNFYNRKTSFLGLRADSEIVNYIYSNNVSRDFCLKIYTPPVFPFTYRYLIDYKNRNLKVKIPSDSFVNNKCWYIIDYDDYKERVSDWRKNNIPEKAKLIKMVNFENGTNVELWGIFDPNVP